jgi:hypothetical protein
MLLDNLFDLLGTHATSLFLLGILGVVGVAPARAVLRPACWSVVDRRVTRRI